MKEQDYGSYIEDIIEHMSYAEEFIKCMTFEEFANDKKTVLSVTKCIEIVGEATKRIDMHATQSLQLVPLWHSDLRILYDLRDLLKHLIL